MKCVKLGEDLRAVIGKSLLKLRMEDIDEKVVDERGQSTDDDV